MATAGADDRVARRLASPVRKWRHPRVSVTFDWNAENMRGRYEGRVPEAGGRRNGARLLAAGAGAPDPVLQFQSRRLSISLSEAQQIAQGAEGSSRSTHTTDDRARKIGCMYVSGFRDFVLHVIRLLPIGYDYTMVGDMQGGTVVRHTNNK